MKICAIVITYYPNVSELVTNIYQYIDNIDHLIIWENTPQPNREEYLIHIPEYSYKITHMGMCDNRGIAFPLNRAVEFCLSNGYSHLLTMDQDSKWHNFEKFKAKIHAIKNTGVAAYTPIIPDIYNWPGIDENYREVAEYITSGTVYDIQIIKEIGLFREDYFIDAVDLEFCYRTRKNSYMTIQLSEGELYHKLGYSKRICKFLSTPNYSAFRTYYIIRNHIWLWREYPSLFHKRIFVLRHTIYRLILILLGEDNKLGKIKSVIKGVVHGISKQYGSNSSCHL